MLELSSLPCAFEAITTPLEIQSSYALLFKVWPRILLHAKLGSSLGMHRLCQCLHCSAHRYRKTCIDACKRAAGADPRHVRKMGWHVVQSHYDPLLEALMAHRSAVDMRDWTPDDFPCLWARIVRLEQHLQTSRPWSIWVLFRDKRDTVQFWTFL